MGIYLISNMVSMPHVRLVDFDARLDMKLQLQGAVSPPVLDPFGRAHHL